MSQHNAKQPPLQQTDEHIRALDPRDHVRLRPAMYLGSTDVKAMTLAAANVVLEAAVQARYEVCTAIKFAVLGPKMLQVWDNGQPLSIADYDDKNHSRLDVALTVVGAAGRLGRFSLSGINVLGVGLSVINALSSHFTIQIVVEGGVWEQQYQKGRKVTDLTRTRDVTDDDWWTTNIALTLDDEVFGEQAFDVKALESMLFDYAHLMPGLNITFENRMTDRHATLCYPQGMAHYLADINRDETPVHSPMILQMQHRGLLINGRFTRPFEIDVAAQFVADPHPEICSFANALDIERRGTHTQACFAALTNALLGHSAIIQRADLPRLFSHLRLVISLWHPAVGFQGSMGRVLLNLDIFQPLYDDLSLVLVHFFQAHPEALPALETLALSTRSKKSVRLPELDMRR